MLSDNTDYSLIPLIPDVKGLEPTHGEFQCRVFHERRKKVLAELSMMTGIPVLAKELKPDKIYRLVIPEGKILQRGKDGLFSGVVYGQKGKISRHAKFERVPMSISRMATAVGAQIMLVSLAVQLNRIETAIAGISEELHDDRIAQVLAGIQQYELSMEMTSKKHRDAAIQNAIQSLVEGLSKIRLELPRRIGNLPNPTNTFWDNWGGSKTRRAACELRLAEEALMAAVRGASVLSQCYAALEEPRAGVEALFRCMKNIESCGIGTAADKARMVEVQDPRSLPEGPWLQFQEAYRGFTQEVERARLDPMHTEHMGVAIEFTKDELLEET